MAIVMMITTMMMIVIGMYDNGDRWYGDDDLVDNGVMSSPFV